MRMTATCYAQDHAGEVIMEKWDRQDWEAALLTVLTLAFTWGALRFIELIGG